MKINLICGIDPEPNGAISAIWTDTKDILSVFIHDTPGQNTIARKEILIHNILDKEAIVKDNKPQRLFTTSRYVFLEKVWAFPGQNAIAMDKFIRSAGIWEGLVTAYNFEITTEPPKTWKKYYNLTSNKKESVAIVAQNFPKLIKKYFADTSESTSHGKAESFLMAAYLLRKMYPNVRFDSIKN